MINEDVLSSYLIYSLPVQYTDQIKIYPVKMKDYLLFQVYEKCLIIRKNSWFPDKKIIKMGYFKFLHFCFLNPDYLKKFNNQDDNFDDSCHYFLYFLNLLKMVCKDNEILYNLTEGRIFIDDLEITEEIFDDIRRIIIIQNAIDFNIDDFINYSTERALRNAKKKINKNGDIATIEDYVDSLMVVLHWTEDEIMNLTIRKFWRFIDRINMRESYTICKTGESSGFVSFKQPIKHWMTSSIKQDQYGDVMIDDKSLRDKING